MHQQVWRRVAGSACRIGPQVVDPDTADVSDWLNTPAQCRNARPSRIRA